MSEATTVSPIDLTDAAVAEVKKLIEQQNLGEGTGLRIGVRGGGCSGMSYALNFESSEREDDTVTEARGIKLFIDPKSASILSNLLIDYTSGLNGSGFVFNNPNATNTCGCGSSFSC